MNNAGRLNRLKDDLIRFRNAVYAYETTDSIRYPENYEKLGLDIAMKAEAIACSVRNIVSTSSHQKKEYIMPAVVKAQEIKVREREDGYEIVMPGLLSKRHYRYNSEFLLAPLSYALEQFCRSHKVERIEQAMIWFQYEYAEDALLWNIRDYDNLESKQVLDVINTFFLMDDGGELCELHYSTKRGKKTCTHIMISRNIGQFRC